MIMYSNLMNGLKLKKQANKLDDSEIKCSLDGYLQSSKHLSKDSEHEDEGHNSKNIDFTLIL